MYVLNMFSMYGRSQTSQDSMHLLNVFSMCFEHVLKVFSMCLVGLKIKSHIFSQKKCCQKKKNWLEALSFVLFSLKQMQEGNWAKNKFQQIRQTYWTHSLQRSGRSVEATTNNQKPCLYKIQPNCDFCWCFDSDPKQRFLHKIQLFWDDFWGCIWTKFLVPIYIRVYRQMPGLCPEPQPRQATHHHHHQTLVEDLQNEDRSLTGVGELNPYWRSSMNVEV